MGYLMTTADSACLFLRIKKNTKYRSVHLPILHSCVIQEKSENFPKDSLVFFLMLEFVLLFKHFFFFFLNQMLTSCARKSSFPVAEAAFCLVWSVTGSPCGLKNASCRYVENGFLEFAFSSPAWTSWLWSVRA